MKKIRILQKIRFEPYSEEFGRAGFDICPVFKRGILRKIYIQKRYQGTCEEFILDLSEELPNDKIRSFELNSDIDDPYVWHEFWCEEHKTICHRLYAPIGTNAIEFNVFFGDLIEIKFVKEEGVEGI